MESAETYLQQAKIRPVGEGGLMVSFGNAIEPAILQCARAMLTELEAHPFPGMLECEASYTGVTIFYDPLEVARSVDLPEDPVLSKGYRAVSGSVDNILKNITFQQETARDKIRIPVCYGGDYGPDLEEVAAYHHMTPDEVVKIHTGGDYLVYMIGFAPGFPYVGGLPPEIATPRKKTPRLKIPVGSVGIAGSQTGAYPLETPGGWQLIGRTPLALFRPWDLAHPSLLQAGDRLEFYAITPQEYESLAAQEKEGGAQ